MGTLAKYDPARRYAWRITKDLLAECEGHESTDGPIGNVVKCDGTCNTGDAGIAGPNAAPDELLARIDAGEGRTFRLYDDDRIHYYTGRLLTSDGLMDDETCYAPLRDFGAGWAGCTEVRWPGHPGWTCG